MKNIIVISLLVLISLPLMAQKRTTLKVKKLHILIIDGDFGPATLKAGLTATKADDDCKPPPCVGIIDPWTCECYPDIKDPWEEDKIARKMKAALAFESAMKRGEGKRLFPPSLVNQANEIFPSRSLKAIVSRLNYYSSKIK